MIHIPNLAEIIMNYEIAFGFLHTYLQFKIFEAKKIMNLKSLVNNLLTANIFESGPMPTP